MTSTASVKWRLYRFPRLLKKTLISYAALGNGIVDMPSSVTVKDGSGNIVSVTSYNYDETAVVG
jgi:hypothetical protein